MIERPGQRGPLRHAAGELVGVDVREPLQAHQSQILLDLVAMAAEHSAGDQTSLDVTANAQPGEQIVVLKH